MQKLRLDLDTLAVESYATQTADEGRGTVNGHLDDTTTFDLGKLSNWCSLGCPSAACEPVDPNDKYRLPDVE